MKIVKLWATGILAMGSFAAFIWSWNNLFLPLWFHSPLLRWSCVFIAISLIAIWLGYMLTETFGDEKKSADIVYTGDGVSGE